MNKTFILAPIAIAISLLSGCANQAPLKIDIPAEITSAERQQTSLRRSILNAEQNRAALQDVNRPYLAGNTEPLAREVNMPSQLRQSVPVTTMFSSSPVDLNTALQQVSQAAGINITATPDALLPASAFARRTGMSVAASPVHAPTRVIVRANNTKLWTVLDDIARQANASWRTVPGGAEFYRVETRTFEIMAVPQTANTTSSLGKSGGTNAQFDSKSSFSMSDQNVISGIQKTVEAMLSTGGKMVLSQETQTLTVTDTTESLNNIERYVKEQNKSLSRRVRMLVEVIEVVSKDSNDLGVDWTMALSVANKALSMGSPTSLAGTQAGSFSLGTSIGKYAGSSVVIKALEEVGKVVSRRSFPVMTTSGRPITQTISSKFDFVKEVQATAISSSLLSTTAQAPTVKQEEETVGTYLTMIPTAKKDGSIFLSISFNVSSAEALRPFTVGSGASAVTVQQRTINGTGTIQEVPIRSGRTEVIGGIEVINSQATNRRLANGAPMLLGGSDSTSSSKSVLVILVTAVAEEGI